MGRPTFKNYQSSQKYFIFKCDFQGPRTNLSYTIADNCSFFSIMMTDDLSFSQYKLSMASISFTKSYFSNVYYDDVCTL